MSIIDVGKWIEMIQTYPVLCDSRLKEYMDSHSTEKIWEMVPETLHSNWADMDSNSGTMQVRRLLNYSTQFNISHMWACLSPLGKCVHISGHMCNIRAHISNIWAHVEHQGRYFWWGHTPIPMARRVPREGGLYIGHRRCRVGTSAPIFWRVAPASHLDSPFDSGNSRSMDTYVAKQVRIIRGKFIYSKII